MMLGVVLVSAVSCLENVEKETSPQAAITSFVVGYYNVMFHDIDWHGRDTIVAYVEGGNMFPMTVDQINNRIYNIDSLSYGSVVSAVTATVNSIGTAFFRYTDDPDSMVTVWSRTDTINFTRPLVFSVLSTDGTYFRDYTVQLNVRKVFPDSLLWSRRDSAGFTAMDRPAAAILGDTLYNFGIDGNGVLSVSARSILEGEWSAPSALSTITSDLWSGNVFAFNGRLYTHSGTSVYESSDGKAWNEVKSGVRYLVKSGSDNGFVWAVSQDGMIIRTSDMSEWVVVGAVPEGFPDSAAVSLDYPLPTNTSISRSILVGPGADSLYASVWAILSTDSVMMEIDAPAKESLRLPVMDGLSVIRYDGHLFAFGNGLEGFRQSNDNGITWYWCDSYADDYSSWNRYMQFPSELRGYEGGFSYAVDRFNSIWIMTSDGQVWRGAITRLDKRGK